MGQENWLWKTEPGKHWWAVLEVRGRVAHAMRKGMICWACGQVGHFAVNCPMRRCWFCREGRKLEKKLPPED